ncbi:MAG TPA: biotin/lipoyl-binding protein [Prolixibacteraceae bacterium]|nr:biotin/lipoyl-binding protein [Prolixibacteraceae bacterium]
MKKFKFTIKGNEYEVKVNDFEENNVMVEVNGTEYNVTIHREIRQSKTPRLVRKPVAQKPGEGTITRKVSGSGTSVLAPLPGNIFKILVAEGDEVKKGETLLIMEAMKMENNVLAEKDGVVKSVKVTIGQAVLQGDVLIEM